MAVDFTVLPVELWERILGYTPAVDVIRFQQTCHAADNLVRDSAALQYRLKQFEMSTTDGRAFAGVAFPTKLSVQEDWYHAWRTISHATTEIHTFLPSDWPEFHLSGSLYVEHPLDDEGPGRFQNRLRFIRMPSQLRGIPLKVWTLEDLPEFEHGSHLSSCDYSQDLLLLIVCSPEPQQASLCVLSCTTGEPHLLAANPTLVTIHNLPEQPFRADSHLEILGSIVFWSYSVGPVGREVRVMDWKQGEILMYLSTAAFTLPAIDIKGLTFMDARHLIILTQHRESRELQLMITDIDALSTLSFTPDSPASLADLPIVARFALPAGANSDQGWFTTGVETRLTSPSSSAEGRFHWHPTTNIAVVPLYERMAEIRNYSIIIPLPALVSYFHLPLRIGAASESAVPWTAWGMHTWTFQPRTFELNGHSICGSRVLASIPEIQQLVLCDFAPAPIRAGVTEHWSADAEIERHMQTMRDEAAVFDPPGVDWTNQRPAFSATITDFTSGWYVLLAEDGLVYMYGERGGYPGDPEARLEMYTV